MNLIGINLDKQVEIPSKKMGIDLGKSLSKIAFIRGNELQLAFIPTQNNLGLIDSYLNSKIEEYEFYSFTGGVAYKLFMKYSKLINSRLLNEFEANSRGIECLYFFEKGQKLPHSLIITIGTGTSIVLKNDSYQHLGGTAIGGGIFMGLITLLFGINNYEEAVKLGQKGNRYKVDLKVSDIYSPEDNRVNAIFREFTAASLGKIDKNYKRGDIQKEDLINSIICCIGENIGTIACLMANQHNIENLVFCGGFLKLNKILRKILSVLCKVNKKRAIFVKNSEYCGAIGALIG